MASSTLTPQAREESKRSWMEAQGGENSHRVAMLPGPGWDFKPISNKPNESQMVEIKNALRNEMCAIFHIPPRMLGDVEKGGRSSAEQGAQELIQYTFAPWITALKLEWKRKLFPSTGIGRTPKNRFYIDFDLTDLIRADAASRQQFYAAGRQWGFLNTNDIRAFEKLNPIEEPWAEDFWMPVNMTLADTPLDPNHQDGDGDGDKPADAPAPEDNDLERQYFRVFRDCFGRLLAREKRDLKAVSAAFSPVLLSLRDASFYTAARQFALDGQPGAETDRFVYEYLGAMEKRASGWTLASIDETAKAELARAIRALRVAAYREVASLKAKALHGPEGVEEHAEV